RRKLASAQTHVLFRFVMAISRRRLRGSAGGVRAARGAAERTGDRARLVRVLGTPPRCGAEAGGSARSTRQPAHARAPYATPRAEFARTGTPSRTRGATTATGRLLAGSRPERRATACRAENIRALSARAPCFDRRLAALTLRPSAAHTRPRASPRCRAG